MDISYNDHLRIGAEKHLAREIRHIQIRLVLGLALMAGFLMYTVKAWHGLGLLPALIGLFISGYVIGGGMPKLWHATLRASVPNRAEIERGMKDGTLNSPAIQRGSRKLKIYSLVRGLILLGLIAMVPAYALYERSTL